MPSDRFFQAMPQTHSAALPCIYIRPEEKSFLHTEEAWHDKPDPGFPASKKPACSSSGRMMISVCGKYSDLWVVLRQAFPGEKLPVTFFCHRRQIQQRDCSGFTPDSLLGSEHGSSHRRCYAGQRRAIGLRQPPLFCSKIIPQPPARRNRAHGNIFCYENYTIFRKCVIFQ